MFFQPIPAQIRLPSPTPEWISTADRLALRASTCLFVAAVGYLGWELLWHSAFLGLLAYVGALTAGVVAAAADLEWRFVTGRRRLKDELFRLPNQSAPLATDNELAAQVDKLLDRYFTKYAQDEVELERWKAATAGIGRFYRDEIIGICRGRGIPVNAVAWLIRYQVCQLKQRWQNENLYEYRRQLVPRPGTVAVRRIGLTVLVLSGICSVVVLRSHPLAGVVALSSGFWMWRSWLRINLERRRYTADSEEHAQREAAIDKEFRRWSEKLEVRPEDAGMVTWLGYDRTVLLGMALDHFRLRRSRLIAHAFLEKAGVAVKRARIEDHPWRYAGYQLRVFLLAEDGVRYVRASLDFITGTLVIRERTSYHYDAIVSVHVKREARRGQLFKLRLAAGDPIVVQVRDPNPDETSQDQDAGPAEETQAVGEAEEDTALDVTSVADLMHMLERIAGEGRKRFQGGDWDGAWSGDHVAGPGEEGT
ncbi:MAG: hypothetical protein ABSA93_32345, partial [Streptosporangiaceae bacterium]